MGFMVRVSSDTIYIVKMFSQDEQKFSKVFDKL